MIMRRASIVTALLWSILLFAASPGLGQNVDDCVFNWFETNYAEYLTPSGQTSQTVAPYYFRYYPQTQGYIGVNTVDNHLYYYGPLYADGFWDLGAMEAWRLHTGCATQAGSENEVRALVDGVLSLTTTTVDDGLTEQFTPIMQALLFGTSTTCAQVTSNVNFAELIQSNDIETALANLPDTINLSADYGNGCQDESGDTVSGSMDMTIQGLAIDQNAGSINLSFIVNIDSLHRNEKLLGDGVLSGSLNANLVNEQISANVEMSQFLVANGQYLDGNLSMSTQGYDIQIGMNMSSGDAFQTNMSITMTVIEDGRYRVNSQQGNVNGYTVEFSDLIFDEVTCEQYPIGGEIIFTKGGEEWIVGFDNSCSGSYNIY